MIRALLWDSDGVLVDSESVFFDFTRAAFARAGIVLQADIWARGYLGEGLRTGDIAERLGVPREQAERIVLERNAAFARRLLEPFDARPGAADLLRRLKRRYRLAVVTGAPLSQFLKVHRHTGLADAFECVVTADETPRVKPHPDLYLRALEHLGLPAAECLAIEDSPRGLQSATAAGIRCVVLRTPLTDLSACRAAAAVIPDLPELEAILETAGR